jgi:hypothetical protein
VRCQRRDSIPTGTRTHFFLLFALVLYFFRAVLCRLECLCWHQRTISCDLISALLAEYIVHCITKSLRNSARKMWNLVSTSIYRLFILSSMEAQTSFLRQLHHRLAIRIKRRLMVRVDRAALPLESMFDPHIICVIRCPILELRESDRCVRYCRQYLETWGQKGYLEITTQMSSLVHHVWLCVCADKQTNKRTDWLTDRQTNSHFLISTCWMHS